jgi:hypothetical protein
MALPFERRQILRQTGTGAGTDIFEISFWPKNSRKRGAIKLAKVLMRESLGRKSNEMDCR